MLELTAVCGNVQLQGLVVLPIQDLSFGGGSHCVRAKTVKAASSSRDTSMCLALYDVMEDLPAVAPPLRFTKKALHARCKMFCLPSGFIILQ